MTKASSIFLVEDNDVVRFKLKSILGRLEEFKIIGEAEDGQTAVEKILQLKPDMALVDIGLPIIDGIEVVRRVKKQLPNMKVIMLTASDSEANIFAALDVGADGYVLKGDFSNTVEIAIRSVRVGAVWLDPGIAKHVLHLARRAALTVAERAPTAKENSTLTANETAMLEQVADAQCSDGVCLVDPSFLRKLNRFSSSHKKYSAPQAPNHATKDGSA